MKLRSFAVLAVSAMVTLALAAWNVDPKLTYREVENWAEFPADVPRGGVSGLDLDSKDQLFVLQRVKPFVLVFDARGKFLRSWNGDFKTPHGLRVDKDDNVWIADMANHLVQKFTPEGKLLLAIGEKDKTGLDGSHFNRPADALLGPDGNIYVGDGYGNSRIAKFDGMGKFLADWGKRGKAAGEFNIPHALAFDGQGNLLVGDRENARVQRFDATGKHLATYRGTGHPYGLAWSQKRIYLADGRTGAVRVLDDDGKLLTQWQAGTKTSAPHWLAVDRQGSVYVGFVGAKKLQKWVPN